MSHVYNVLFLCTGNSARSIMAEAMLNSDEEIRHVFSTVCREIKTRLDIFCSLPLEKLDKLALKREMDNIGGNNR